MVCGLDDCKDQVSHAVQGNVFVYTNKAFTKVYPTESNQQIPANASLNDFCSNDVGIPEKLASDRSPELCSRKSTFLAHAKLKGIDLKYAEPERKNQIWRVDNEIRKLKTGLTTRWHPKAPQHTYGTLD